MAGSLVQSAIGNTTGALTFSIAFPVANTAGNAIAVFAGDGAGSGATMTITDTSNTYGANLNTVNDGVDGNTGISNAAANIAAGANTVKVTNSATHQMGLAIAEIAGVTATPISTHAAQPLYASTAPSSGNATPGATAFGVGFTFLLGATVAVPTPGAGWTSAAGGNITVSSTSFANGTAGTGACRLEWQAGMSGANPALFSSANSDWATFLLYFLESGGVAAVQQRLMLMGMGS